MWVLQDPYGYNGLLLHATNYYSNNLNWSENFWTLKRSRKPENRSSPDNQYWGKNIEILSYTLQQIIQYTSFKHLRTLAASASTQDTRISSNHDSIPKSSSSSSSGKLFALALPIAPRSLARSLYTPLNIHAALQQLVAVQLTRALAGFVVLGFRSICPAALIRARRARGPSSPPRSISLIKPRRDARLDSPLVVIGTSACPLPPGLR